MISKDLAVSDGFGLSPALHDAWREGGTIGQPLRRSSRHAHSVSQFCPNPANPQYLRDFRHLWAWARSRRQHDLVCRKGRCMLPTRR